jgi:ParB-like chromosome segregation protein Spo0J
MELVNIKDIKENPNNPRNINEQSFKKLKKSLKDFPQMLDIRPLVIDDEGIVLGGNMRLKALKELGYKEVPILRVSNLTEEQKNEFIIKDNISYGDWNWEDISLNWDTEVLTDWGLEIIGFDIDPDDMGDTFDLPDGEKKKLQQQTYTLADEQAALVKSAIDEIKKTEEFKWVETFGNENSNGNALYLIISKWKAMNN